MNMVNRCVFLRKQYLGIRILNCLLSRNVTVMSCCKFKTLILDIYSDVFLYWSEYDLALHFQTVEVISVMMFLWNFKFVMNLQLLLPFNQLFIHLPAPTWILRSEFVELSVAYRMSSWTLEKNRPVISEQSATFSSSSTSPDSLNTVMRPCLQTS